ncbi:MAG: phosphoglucosamine mutase [Acidimicrobiia bacterium]|nr:phosphoglucosamine mutase [Acidimicrobiia bacterium]
MGPRPAVRSAAAGCVTRSDVLKFGTDGVRGVANLDLTNEVVTALGRAAARVLGGDRFVVGRDTRRSGGRLEASLVEGLVAEGMAVRVLAVAPTPAVAWVAAAEGIPGAVVSASHNSFEDNGVKLFAAGGLKLGREVEVAVEAEFHRLLRGDPATVVEAAAAPGSVVQGMGDVARWAASVAASIDGRSLEGLRVVVDCANGSASGIGPEVLRSLGAQVEVLHADPDGTNINAGCGSTYPRELQRVVVQRGADAGIAFDGDADRVLAVDAAGRVIDGDQIIAVCAVDRRVRACLPQDTVVVTVMTNLGFRLGMADHGVTVFQVPVGDRHVLEAMAEGGYALGGEQSGHVIFSDLATTGDGLLTAVQLLDVVARAGRPLAELADAAMTRLPQVLRNVSVSVASPDAIAALEAEIAAVEAELGEHGRVLIRASGTEPVVRVMVEAATAAQAERAAEHLAGLVADLPPR